MSSFDALVLSLPTRNSTVRMRLWRALKENGCGVLRDGVYLLPNTRGNGTLERLEAEIRMHKGFAMRLQVVPVDEKQSDELQKLFDRSNDYAPLVKSMATTRSSLARLGARKGQTAIRRLHPPCQTGVS